MALQQAHDRGLVHAAGTVNLRGALALVHEPRLAADEGFIDFNIAGHAAEGAGLHRKPDAVEHEPSGLLSDADGTAQLGRTDAVLVIDQHPHGGEPLVETDGAVFHDGADLDRELPLGVAGLARPQATAGDEGYFRAATGRAYHDAVRPAQRGHELKGRVGVGELGDRFDEGGWHLHGSLLPSQDTPESLLSQVYCYPN